MTNLLAAMELAGRGFRVFPAENKRPLVRWKDEATDDYATVEAWWAKWPDAEVGVPIPPGYVAVDIDDLAAVRAAKLAFPLTLGQQTRSGGFHFFYEADEPADVPQVVGRNGIKLDTRVGGRGYVIAYDIDAFHMDQWTSAPGWVYEDARPAPVERPPDAPMGTHADIISWLGRFVNANGGTLTATDIFAVLQAKKHSGAIIDLNPAEPWTNADFQRMAQDAAAWEVTQVIDPAKLVQALAPKQVNEDADEPLRDFINIRDYRDGVPKDIPWVVEGMIYRGGVTLLSGPAKAGKSTFAAQIQRCRETGAELLGHPVVRGPTLLVTEESGVAVVYKTDGLEELVVYDRRAAAGESFEMTLNRVITWCEANPDGLVFIDTLAVWAGIDDENDASKTTKAIGLIMRVAQTLDVPIVIIHHTRKGGGKDGEAIRGSGAILATVDMSAELARPSTGDKSDRTLAVQGRVILPTFHSLAFDTDSLSYKFRPDRRLENIEEDVETLPDGAPGVKRSETTLANDLARGHRPQHWTGGRYTRLDELVEMGRVHVEGEGSGVTKRYWRIPPASLPERWYSRPDGDWSDLQEDDD